MSIRYVVVSAIAHGEQRGHRVRDTMAQFRKAVSAR